jgi:simple sugar transport system ATP-binding protein
MSTTAVPVLEVRGARKSFGAVSALAGVDLELHKGEVLALLGDNGAGKSTLVKAMTGVHQLDGGELLIDGEPRRFKSPADARKLGIETVYQTLAVFDNLSARANLFLGREPAGPSWLGPFALLKERTMARQWEEHISRMKVTIPRSSQSVGVMSGGQRQAIAVARTVHSEADILLLDEPLAAMGAKEGAMILDLIERLKAEGNVSIIMVLHNYVHVLTSCDRVNLIQDGVISLDKPTAETSVEELTEIVVEEYRRARQAAQAQ